MAREGKDLSVLIQEQKPNIEALLKDNPALSAERIISLFWGATRQSYNLQRCTPDSLIRALLQAAAVGVEVNTPLQHAAIIPRKVRGEGGEVYVATFQLMYRGWMYLGMTHAGLLDWRAEAVYYQDDFAYRPTSTDEPIRHEPELDRAKGPDDLRGAYSLMFLPSGLVRAVWLPRSEIESIRDRYSESWRAYQHDKNKTDTPWLQRPAEMFIKTAVNRHAKQVKMAGPPPVALVDGRSFSRGPAAALEMPDEDTGEEEVMMLEAPVPPHKTGTQGNRRGGGDTGVNLNPAPTTPAPSPPPADGPIGEEAAKPVEEIARRLTVPQIVGVCKKYHIDSFEQLPRSQLQALLNELGELVGAGK